jgi:hypothetical protein
VALELAKSDSEVLQDISDHYYTAGTKVERNFVFNVLSTKRYFYMYFVITHKKRVGVQVLFDLEKR